MRKASPILGVGVLTLGLCLYASGPARAMDDEKASNPYWAPIRSLKMGANFMDKHVLCPKDTGTDMDLGAELMFERMSTTTNDRYSFVKANEETLAKLKATGWQPDSGSEVHVYDDTKKKGKGDKLEANKTYTSTEKFRYFDVTWKDKNAEKQFERKIASESLRKNQRQVIPLLKEFIKVEEKTGTLTLTTIGGGGDGGVFNHWGASGRN
jgi:hypothetical protein